MGIVEDCNNIVSISSVDSFKIHALSFCWGFWSLLKKLASQAWTSKSDTSQKRDSPPSCLVDNSLGQHSYVKLKGVKLHYVESGERDSPVLLLLHGFPDCWISWRHQIPELAKHFRVIAVDLKGFGDSDKPEPRRCYRVDVLVDELRELIAALGVASVTLVGHDLGALLGWFLVHRAPQLVVKFVALAAPHPNLYWTHLPSSSTFNTSWIHYSQLPHLPEYDALQDDLSIINKCYQHLKTSNESYLNAYKYSFSRKEDWTGAINYYRNLPFSRIVMTETEARLHIPCLLIVGSKDPDVSLESMVKSAEYIDKFSVKIIDGVGHFLHQENPQEVNKVLVSFLVGAATPSLPKPGNGLVDRMFGAVSSTVQYGNDILNVVHRKANGFSSRALLGNTTS